MDEANAGQLYGAFPAFGEKSAAESLRYQAGDEICRRALKANLRGKAGLFTQ